MTPPLLTLQDIHLTFGGTALLEGAELAISKHERLCLVGRNGSGKSTLLKIAAGMVEADSGTRFVQPGTTIRYLPQEPDFSGYDNTLAYVEAGLGPGDDSYRAAFLLQQLGHDGTEKLDQLSGGEGRRAALARALAPAPDILLLDEPTNHLDLPVIEWLEQELKSMRSALVLISHDRRFLENLSRGTVWLDRGKTRQLSRGFGEFEAWRDELLEQEDIDAHKLDRKIKREEYWIVHGVTARRKRNVRRVKELATLRADRVKSRVDQTRAKANVEMVAHVGSSSGRIVIDAKNVSKSYGQRQIINDFSIKIIRGDRLGIVGPNGSGKTTLLNLIAGLQPSDTGTIKIGSNVEMLTLDQTRESLDPNLTLRDALTGGGSDMIPLTDGPRHVIGYMKDFLFQPEQARTVISKLSGGERGRLMLARALAKPSNLLMLDEPTNDLDLETLDLLEEMLGDYTGTVILVSHDRDFLDRVVTSVVYGAGDGNWVEYAGGYSDMIRQRDVVKTQPDTPEQSRRKSTSQSNSATTPAAAKRRLSFKEKHALETLPAKISNLEAIISKAIGKLDDGDFFTRDPAGFQQIVDSLTRDKQKLEELEHQWLELEMLREELGATL